MSNFTCNKINNGIVDAKQRILVIGDLHADFNKTKELFIHFNLIDVNENWIASPKETTVVDLNHLLKECFGEIDMLNELVKLFKLNAIEFIGNVKIHLKTENLKEIALSAHKLKAGFAMVKADGMRKLIVDLEASCKAHQPEKVKELYELFLTDYPLLEENLDMDLKTINNK